MVQFRLLPAGEISASLGGQSGLFRPVYTSAKLLAIFFQQALDSEQSLEERNAGDYSYAQEYPGHQRKAGKAVRDQAAPENNDPLGSGHQAVPGKGSQAFSPRTKVADALGKNEG